MATASAGIGAERSPRDLANSSTPVMTAARSTDELGRTKKMNTIKKMAIVIQRNFPLIRNARPIRSRSAATIAKFAPLTAVK